MTSPAAKQLAEAMTESVGRNRTQVALTEESRVLLTAMLRDEMADSFSRGLKDAMTSDNARQFVRTMLAEAQEMATERTGRIVGNAVLALARRALLFIFLGSIVYALGGWSALASLMKFLKGAA